MGGPFVITLREGFEAALLLGIVYSYLAQIGARHHFGYVTLGACLGLVASVLLGLAVTLLSGPLVDLGPDLIGAAILFTAAGMLTWHAWWMQRHARALRGDLQQRIDTAESTQQFWVVGIIAFAGVFREGAETVLFLWGLWTQAAETGPAGVGGALLGVAVAVALGILIFRGGRRLSLHRFFAITTAFIVLLAAGLFSTGVGRLQGLGVLPPSGAAWDSSALLDERGLVGSLLGGLIGYRSRPSPWEVGAYLGYLAFAVCLLRVGGRAAGSAPIRGAAPAGSGPARR